MRRQHVKVTRQHRNTIQSEKNQRYLYDCVFTIINYGIN